MFILEKPYISETLKNTIKENDWNVLDNGIISNEDVKKITSEEAENMFKTEKNPLIYSNSENAITWILDKLPNSDLSDYIKLFKDKIEFRKLLKSLYPDFYFKTVEFKDIKNIKASEIKFPVIIKPAVGFLSFGVHAINNENEWDETINLLEKEMEVASSMYPKHVINSSMFIIEELIEGDEFAIDAYYDKNGEAVILNIFEHPFFDSKDVSDRIYIMSKKIMEKYYDKFQQLLSSIGKLKNIKLFPMHIEVRVTKAGVVVPIEINPMRFAGWCTTDVANYAWGINVYDYFYNQKRPNWNGILKNHDDKIYYFSMAEVQSGINKNEINGFDYERFLANYSNILELRKIEYKNNPLFAVIFGSTNDENEVKRILALRTKDYIF